MWSVNQYHLAAAEARWGEEFNDELLIEAMSALDNPAEAPEAVDPQEDFAYLTTYRFHMKK